MRGTVFALIILFLVLGLVVTNSFILHSLIDQTIKSVKEIEVENTLEATKRFEECYKSFARRERYISLSVSHKDLMSINDCFSDIIGAGIAGDKEEMIITKNRLVSSLEHLRRLSGVNIDSILFVDGHILCIRRFTHN